MHRRHVLAGSAAASLVVLSRSAFAQTPSAATRTVTDARGTVDVPAEPERVIALGEEFLLADLLELGITPIASSANFLTGYVGIDPKLTAGLEPFTLQEADLEALAMLDPDLILLPESYCAYTPESFVEIATFVPLVVLPDTPVYQDGFRFLASVFGREALADEKIADLERVISSAAEDLALEGQTASFASIYEGGGNLALWLTDQVPTVEIAMALGLTVEPAAEDYDTDDNGRAWLSTEEAGVLTGETVFMLQTSAEISPGEAESFDEEMEQPIWQTLPAVKNDRLVVIERIGYPGAITGRRSLVEMYQRVYGDPEVVATPDA